LGSGRGAQPAANSSQAAATMPNVMRSERDPSGSG